MTQSSSLNLLKPALPILFLSLSFAQNSIPVAAQNQLQSQLTTDIYNQLIADFASDSYAHTTNTGNNTTNNTSQVSQANTSTTNTNEAEVTQQVNAIANTGYNEASRNISIGGHAGIITTGDARVESVAVTSVNQTEASLAGNAVANPHHSELVSTEDNTTTLSHSALTTNVVLAGNNQATIYQGTNASATTGNNVADRNISMRGGLAGVIKTGDASVSTGYMVAANNSVLVIGGTADQKGPGTGASIIVDNTGENTRFTFSDLRTQKLYSTTNSTATVTQSCGSSQGGMLTQFIVQDGCQAITGFNTSNRNIAKGGDAGVITTGDAYVAASFLSKVNTTTSATTTPSVNSDHSASLQNTGNNLQTTTENQNSATTQSIVFQDADVTQTVTAVADTGHNTANRNISIGGNAGVITTGNAYVQVLLAALVNSSQQDASLVSLP